MDRNFCCDYIFWLFEWVALRKESVDRNLLVGLVFVWFVWSLSARRAWIEIFGRSGPRWGRDRSLSARRAWIEILSAVLTELLILSLSARRAWIEMFSVREVFANFEGRSPQGERG